LFAELSLTDTKTVSKHGDLFIADTHGAGKSSTATPAPLTFESKSIVIPRLVAHGKTPLSYERIQGNIPSLMLIYVI
jgi:hypothetical protein